MCKTKDLACLAVEDVLCLFDASLYNNQPLLFSYQERQDVATGAE
jgi:hypothetical protein